MIAPCKDCRERHLGCHSECEKYKAYRETLDSKNAKRKEEINIDSTIDHLLFNRLKHQRSLRRKKK